jgi:hypothetical protein
VCPFTLISYVSIYSFQIARLYRPLDTDPDSEFSDQEETALQDLESARSAPQTPASSRMKGKSKGKGKSYKLELSDVWNEREELFGIGDSEDEYSEDEVEEGRRSREDDLEAGREVPKIFVTSA